MAVTRSCAVALACEHEGWLVEAATADEALDIVHVTVPRERDALIAATAFVHGMTVVTGNVADFEATGVALTDPWAET